MAKKKRLDKEHFRELGRLSYKKRAAELRDPEHFRELGRKSAEARRSGIGDEAFREQMAGLNSLRTKGTEPCRHCGGRLGKNNKSGFCRECQRGLGLPELRRITVADESEER